MARLVIVAGASGAGKSFLLENISIMDSRVKPIRKLTTRTPRPYEHERIQEHLDLEFSCALSAVSSCDYCYYYGSDWYGLRKADIDRSIRSGVNPVVIVRNSETIIRIRQDYPNALVVYLQSALSGDDLKNKLLSQGRSDLDIDERMRRHQDDFHDYVSHLNLYSYVIINYFDRSTLLEQVQRIFQYEIFSIETGHNLVFVLMSFNHQLLEIYKAIQNAGRLLPELHIRAERAGIRKGDYSITEDILSRIRAASLIVCDLTEERPNVYYELGYCRGIRKRVISCARAGTPLHFDIKDFKTIFYSSPLELQEQMTEEFAFHFGSQDN